MRALLLSSLLVAGCAHMGVGAQKPMAKLVGADVGGISADGATARIVVRVDNQNPMDIDLVVINWSATLDGKPVAQGSQEEKQKVPNHGGGEMTIPVQLHWKPEQVAGKDQVPWTVHLEFGFAVTGSVVAVPVDAQGTFPVPHASQP
jgi:LEA14-like dessication related protein